jgi:hypothetical protein
MILAPNALPGQLAHLLDTALVSLQAAAEDGSEVAQLGLQDVQKLLSNLGAEFVDPYPDLREGVAVGSVELPDLTHTTCSACQGEGGFDGDDTDPGGACALCAGTGEVEVCMGCGCVPTVLNGVDYCHCAAGFEFEEWREAA